MDAAISSWALSSGGAVSYALYWTYLLYSAFNIFFLYRYAFGMRNVHAQYLRTTYGMFLTHYIGSTAGILSLIALHDAPHSYIIFVLIGSAWMEKNRRHSRVFLTGILAKEKATRESIRGVLNSKTSTLSAIDRATIHKLLS